MVEIVLPSATPASSLEATPITFPNSLAEVAPTYTMKAYNATLSSSSLNCFGKNSLNTST